MDSTAPPVWLSSELERQTFVFGRIVSSGRADQKLRLVFSMHTVPDSDGRSGSVKIRRVLFGQCN